MSANLRSTLTVALVDDVSKPARSVAQALKAAEKEAQAVAKAMAGTNASNKFVADLGKLKLGARDIEAVSKAWQDYSKSAGLAVGATAWTKAQAASVRAWERQTIASLRDVRREQVAFARATAAAGSGGVSPIALAMSQGTMANKKLIAGMSSAGARSAPIKAGAAELAAGGGLAGGMGLGTIAAGYGAYTAGRHALKSGAEYQHEAVALENAGRSLSELHEIEERAREVAKAVPTSTLTENLKTINETVGAFGDLHHALENLPFMAKAASILKTAAGDKIGADAGAIGNKFARFFELRGTAGNSATFQKEANEMVRPMVFSRGNFNPDEMLNFAQQAKQSLQNYDLRFMSKIMPSIVTEIGGERAGTAANAFTNTILGKARDKIQAAAWVKYGLLDPTKLRGGKGSPLGWKAGAVKGTDEALRDPLSWMENVQLPALKAKGVDIENSLELTKALNELYRNSNANQMANIVGQLKSRMRLHKDEANINAAGTAEDIYKRNATSDPTVASASLSAAFDNLGAAVTKALPLASMINTLAYALDSVATKGPGEAGAEWLEKVGRGWSRVGNNVVSAGSDWWAKYTGARGAFDESKLWKPGPSKPAGPMMTQVEGGTPHLDLHEVDAAKANVVAEASGMKEALEFSATPHVDSGPAVGALREITAAANEARAAVDGLAANARSQAAAARAAFRSLGSIQRGHFSFGGVQGE